MADVQQVEERGRQGITGHATGENRRDLGKARAFLVTGLAWAGVVVVSWLCWWLIGDGGREALAGTVGLSAAQLTPYVLAALVAEKLAAKGLLFAALYHWLRNR